MEVLDVPLIPRLRPTAHGGPPRFDVLHLVFGLSRAEPEYVQASRIRVGNERGIARELVVQTHQRIEVRNGSNEQPVRLKRYVELNGVEEVGGGRAGKQGDSV